MEQSHQKAAFAGLSSTFIIDAGAKKNGWPENLWRT